MTVKCESSANAGNIPKVASVEKQRRKKKKRLQKTGVGSTFSDLYKLTGEHLGEGSYGRVETCVNVFTGLEYAVKIIEKTPGVFSRSKMLKEIEIFYLCRGQQNIIQLIEYFEEPEGFYLVFEKIDGGPLLKHIQERVSFTEKEASKIMKQLAEAIRHLHEKGIAHRDIKPDNVLCVNSDSPCPVKLCDFDLCSKPVEIGGPSTPSLLTPVGSLEYMAPEVADTFLWDDYGDCEDEQMDPIYTKKCDLWSLGIIMYILLCGYVPFSGSCGADCGWDRGASCQDCQDSLFLNIKGQEVIFPPQHWSSVSEDAKDLITHLLTKDSSSRIDANQLLSHPWIILEGCSNSLETPGNLKKQPSIQELEDFASRAMAVNRAIEKDNESHFEMTTPIPWNKSKLSSDFTPANLSKSSLIQRRRKSREKEKIFAIIEELETELLMRTIY